MWFIQREKLLSISLDSNTTFKFVSFGLSRNPGKQYFKSLRELRAIPSMKRRMDVTLSLEATIILTGSVSEDNIQHIRKWNDVQINGIELRAINSQLNYDMSEWSREKTICLTGKWNKMRMLKSTLILNKWNIFYIFLSSWEKLQKKKWKVEW